MNLTSAARAAAVFERLAQRLKPEKRDELVRTLGRAVQEAQRTYDGLLEQSLALPKISLDCSGQARCTKQSEARTLAAYHRQLNNLRWLAFFIDRKAGETFGGSVERQVTSVGRRRIRRLHTAAVNAGKHLPRATYVCSAS